MLLAVFARPILLGRLRLLVMVTIAHARPIVRRTPRGAWLLGRLRTYCHLVLRFRRCENSNAHQEIVPYMGRLCQGGLEPLSPARQSSRAEVKHQPLAGGVNRFLPPHHHHSLHSLSPPHPPIGGVGREREMVRERDLPRGENRGESGRWGEWRSRERCHPKWDQYLDTSSQISFLTPPSSGPRIPSPTLLETPRDL